MAWIIWIMRTVVLCCFFFSSRRRHTRFDCDWSSDVCSSDLNKVPETRVKELIEKWGCIPRRVFVEYNDEPKLKYLVSKCNVYKYLQNDGSEIGRASCRERV